MPSPFQGIDNTSIRIVQHFSCSYWLVCKGVNMYRLWTYKQYGAWTSRLGQSASR